MLYGLPIFNFEFCARPDFRAGFFVAAPMRRNQRSAEAQAYRRWYHTTRWQTRRAAQLSAEPLCRMCRAEGRITPATVADHVTPHKGDAALFWTGALQSLCASHHNSTKQSEERTGDIKGVDARGRPLDPAHLWNRT